eukprot:190727-Prymnesium_polylepis.1
MKTSLKISHGARAIGSTHTQPRQNQAGKSSPHASGRSEKAPRPGAHRAYTQAPGKRMARWGLDPCHLQMGEQG